VFEITPFNYGSFPGANTFTVIVGKNGTGKSRLLQGIVKGVLSEHVSAELFDPEERTGRIKYSPSTVELTEKPSKVICVSTSPFDKFPLLRRTETSQSYSYLGLRGLPSSNLSTSYMARIIASLILSIARSPDKSKGVADVLRYLGYEGVIHCTFSIGIHSRLQNEILESSDPLNTISQLKQALLPTNDGTSVIRQLQESDSDTVLHALDVLRDYKRSKRKPRIDLFITNEGLYSENISIIDILPLVCTGLARLRDVAVQKHDAHNADTFRLSEASSGEQSVVMGLLGIASQIEDNSLICIDEPEVCLHPEWQERYVHLLVDTFSNRKNCQFIIATHSPQIVAELPNANCFVMNMADGKSLHASSFSHRSIDFQLASVFNTPGRNNEFLNRTALNLFAKISREKSLSNEDRNELDFLNSLQERINKDDPIIELIAALNEMRNIYG
jgi:predicted ATPase